MAGAAPPSLADDLTSGGEAPSWLSLPHAILVHALRMMPQDARARAACVCRTWRDAAADPALFAVLRLDDSSYGRLNDASLLRLCVRAGAALRELCLNAPACRAVTVAGVIAALRAGGCAGVQRLVLPPKMNFYHNMSAEQAQELAAACLILEHLACDVYCESADDVATTCALLPGPLSLFVDNENLDAARAALQLPAQMTGLDIWACTLDAACVAALREALRTNTTLKTLALWHTEIGGAGAAALGDALRTNATLTELELGDGNSIGDAGATALGEALRTNATLTSLYLTHNDIGDAGAAALGVALRTNATLKTLNLEGNRFGAAGGAALGEALRSNAVLTTLYLGHGFGDAVAAALTEALRTNTTLTTLTLNGRNIVGGGRG